MLRYSEEATKFCEISTSDLTDVNVDVKSNVVIWQNYVTFSQNLDFFHVNQQMESLKNPT